MPSYFDKYILMKPGKTKLFIALLLINTSLMAQDPHFSQFFSAPFAVNPGLTGVINGDWRFVANWRQQWIGPGYPYSTATLCYDSKLMKNRLGESQVLGIGGMLMYDRTMGGAFNSIYATADMAYHMSFDEDHKHWLGMGFGITYGDRRIDFSKLYFAEQFTSNGFNTSLPTGESSLSAIKPYLSLSAGAVYGYHSDLTNINFGASVFHINKPRQTALQNDDQRLPQRYVGYYDLDTYINDRVTFYSSGIYQLQSGSEYFSFGGAFGYDLNEGLDQSFFIAGLWYRNNDALCPYAGLAVNNWQLGFTYDVTLSHLSHAPHPPKSWELSFILRTPSLLHKGIRCPWR